MQTDAVINKEKNCKITEHINKTPATGKDGMLLILQQFFSSISLQDETLNGTGCGKTAAVWID